MAKESQPERITVVETEQRLRAVLKGAFNGPPTPQKDIPKKQKSPKQAKRVARGHHTLYDAIPAGLVNRKATYRRSDAIAI